MNPYEDGADGKEDFPSLDSLFEDDEPASASSTTSKNNDDAFPSLDALDIGEDNEQEEKKNQPKPENKMSSADIDIQKELEAKFDELFGALDDSD